MKAQITAAPLNSTSRTVDLTIKVYSNLGVLLSTHTSILIPVDDFSEELVITRVKELLNTETIKDTSLPLTQAQINAQILDMWIMI